MNAHLVSLLGENLGFVSNICDVEDFVVKLLLLFLVCQDGVSC